MKSYVLVPLIFLAWIVIWIFPLHFFGYAIPNSLNELGDSFGVASSFFTAAAFAGMAYSVYIQSTQNKETAASLERQAETLAKQSESMEKQAEYLKLAAAAHQQQSESLGRTAQYQKQAADAQCQQVEALAKQLENTEKQLQALSEQIRNSFIERLSTELNAIRDLGHAVSGVKPGDNVRVEEARIKLGTAYDRLIILIKQVRDRDTYNMTPVFKEILETFSPSLRACFFNAIYSGHPKATLSEDAKFISKHYLLGYVEGANETAPIKLKSYMSVARDN